MLRNAYLPVLTILTAIVGIWYLSVAPMNIRVALDQAERGGAVVEPKGSNARRDTSVWRLVLNNASYVAMAYDLKRPRLPTPSQVGRELWKTTGAMALKGRAWSKRSLIHHAWITLKSTFWGFLLGTGLGIAAAVAIVYSRVVDMSRSMAFIRLPRKGTSVMTAQTRPSRLMTSDPPPSVSRYSKTSGTSLLTVLP